MKMVDAIGHGQRCIFRQQLNRLEHHTGRLASGSIKNDTPVIEITGGTEIRRSDAEKAKEKASDITYPVERTEKQKWFGSDLHPPKEGTGEEKHSEPDLKFYIIEMQRKCVTLMLLWEEYKAAHPDGLMYMQFCQRYRDFRKYPRRIFFTQSRS